jgi:hypothetical protein
MPRDHGAAEPFLADEVDLRSSGRKPFRLVLAPDAGGDLMHNGPRRWTSQADPEWQALAAWVRGEATGPVCPPALRFEDRSP